MSYFCLNLGQTAEDSDMFTNIWLSSRGLTGIGIFNYNSLAEPYKQYRCIYLHIYIISYSWGNKKVNVSLIIGIFCVVL